MDLESALSTAKALADRSRLLILNALRDRPMCTEEIAAALDLAPSTVSFHLRKLADTGLVVGRKDQYYVVYSLRTEALVWSVDDLVGFPNPEAVAQESRTAQERRAVLAAFFSEGRLLRMPAQKRKRLIVTEVFAGMFTPGREYTEADVDEAIRSRFDDHCLVRRLLVDEGFFTRDHGVYRRTDKPGTDPHATARTQTTPERGPTTERRGGTTVDTRKKTLKRGYLEQGREAGIFRIVSTQTGRSLVGSSLDVRAALNRYEFELTHGSHRNRALQEDFDRLGRETFTFESVEIVDGQLDPSEVEQELEALEERFAATLVRDPGYNTPGDFRVPPKRRRRTEPTTRSTG